jgi:hypothetical protein
VGLKLIDIKLMRIFFYSNFNSPGFKIVLSIGVSIFYNETPLGTVN